jgi:hypothetical protein
MGNLSFRKGKRRRLGSIRALRLFSWLPGPAFIGTYEMVFLKTDGFGIATRIPIRVKSRSKFHNNETTAR